MYKFDPVTVVDYDPECDAITFFPNCEILKQSEYVETFDFDTVFVDIGDSNNIRCIEVLDASKAFTTTVDALQEIHTFSVKYEASESGDNELVITIDDIGTLNIKWNDRDVE